MTISPIHRPTFVNALGISLGQELGPFSGLMAARFLKLICRTTMMLWWVCAAGKYSDLVHASIDFVVDWQHRPFCPQELCMCWLGNRCRFWTGFPKQMCQTFCISLVWRVCSCGISKLRYLHDGGLDKLQLESALLCNEKYIYVHIVMEAAEIWSIFTVKLWLLLKLLLFILQCFCLNKEFFFLLLDHISWINIEHRFLYFLNTFLGSMSKLPFLWKNFVRIIPDKCLGLFHDIGLFEYLGLFHDTRLVE